MANITIDDVNYVDVSNIYLPIANTSNEQRFMIPPTNTKEITANGNGINVQEYGTVNVNVPSDAPDTEIGSAAPTEEVQQIYPTANKVFSRFDIDAIPSDYVGSGIPRKSSSNISASGSNVIVPAGYYENGGSKSVELGNEGTPSATKGAVSNHAVSITPTVTNTEGYINGGTRTGTPVTVTASELVSGSETKTANGTYDVTNLAEITVQVSGSSAVLTTKTVTDNGTYNASADNADGYSSVTVAIPVYSGAIV